MSNSIEKIWFEDPIHFITIKNYNKFFPTDSMTFAEQLNSIFRLSIYFSILVLLLKQNLNILFVAAFMGIFTYVLYNIDTINKNKEKLYLEDNNLSKDPHSGEECIKPSKNNPFMNVLMSDYSLQPNRPKGCKITNSNIKKEAKDAFDYGLYRDIGDIFGNLASDRQFVTNPSTMIPNDRETLTNWLYKSGSKKTCKEDGTQCYALQYNTITPT
jgi:hypothetical protein